MKTIDAKNRSIGRVATEAAMALMGKDKANYRDNVVSDIKVTIINASQLKIDQKKLKNKIYQTYSGYPGGQKEKTLEQLITKKGYSDVLIHAINGMIPTNRLKKDRLKNLEIID